MSDIGLFLVEGCFDVKVENGDLKSDDGLETAVIISLFTDRRVSEQQLPDLAVSKRGWWGDMFSDIDGDQIGSRLWTIERRKRTDETLRLYEDFAKEALDWLIEDGVASTITVLAAYDSQGQAVGEIIITRPSGATSRYDANWDAQELKRGA